MEPKRQMRHYHTLFSTLNFSMPSGCMPNISVRLPTDSVEVIQFISSFFLLMAWCPQARYVHMQLYSKRTTRISVHWSSQRCGRHQHQRQHQGKSKIPPAFRVERNATNSPHSRHICLRFRRFSPLFFVVYFCAVHILDWVKWFEREGDGDVWHWLAAFHRRRLIPLLLLHTLLMK